MKKFLFFLFTLFFVTQAFAQLDDFYVAKDNANNDIYYITFSELFAYPKKFVGKDIDIKGFCAKLYESDDKIFIFSSKEASDRIDMREAVRLRYVAEETASQKMKKDVYFLMIKRVLNQSCRVEGAYSLASSAFLTVPSHGSIAVNYLDPGMGREEKSHSSSETPKK